MPNKQSSTRLERVKSEMSGRRRSMDGLKTRFRNEFFNRLRISRSRSVGRLRETDEDYEEEIQYKCISGIYKALVGDQEAANRVKPGEDKDLVNQIEKELALVSIQSEAEGRLQEHQVEREDIVNRHI